ncbi:MAG: hypothetical protein ACI89J_002526 [Hyphomicrobiaceae bacterium]|jgi:hypothetical protein
MGMTGGNGVKMSLMAALIKFRQAGSAYDAFG